MTTPTACPPRCGSASVAAIGTSICAATENRPATAMPVDSSESESAKPLMNCPSAASSMSPTASARRSSMSPSGTSSSSPQA